MHDARESDPRQSKKEALRLAHLINATNRIGFAANALARAAADLGDDDPEQRDLAAALADQARVLQRATIKLIGETRP